MTACDFILVICALLFFVPILMLVRNEWVYKSRDKLISERFDEYDDYLDYDAMMRKFWVWDIEKLKK